jgi:ADP-heptose:LPS heptosyltransferase
VRGFLRYRHRWTRFPRWIANATQLRRHGAPDYATGHAIDNNLAMAVALGLEPTTDQLALPHLAEPSQGPENFVLVHPGASRETKRWPVENWARLCDALADRYGCAIGLTGDRSEHSLAAHIAASMKTRDRGQILAGKLSLVELARTQARGLAFLSGDTGPYHLAVAVGCPTLTLFAPTDRGSSVEACGPHHAPAELHRALQTEYFGASIQTLRWERVLEEAIALIEASRARIARAP